MTHGIPSVEQPAPVGRIDTGGSAKDAVFYLLWGLIIGALVFEGYGNTILGQQLPNNVSAYLIYGAFFVQLVSFRISLPHILLWLFVYVFFQTFVLNFSQDLAEASLIHFFGLVLFSLTAFSFVSYYRRRAVEMVRLYYGFTVVIACFAFLQTGAFVLFHRSIYLQSFLGGQEVTTGALRPDIFGLLPRAPGIAAEPAHFALLLLPGVYVATLVLTRQAGALRLKNKLTALVVISGLLLSFSLLGYIGLVLILLMSQRATLGKRRLRGVAAVCVIFIGGYFVASQLPMFRVKLATLLEFPISSSTYQFTGSDLSGFALISNALVAASALTHSHFLGTGIKTHEQNYDRYLPLRFSARQVLLQLNKKDAGSLFIRVASELGLPGLLAMVGFLVRYKLKGNSGASDCKIVNDAAFAYLVLYCARSGSYLDIALWLFGAFYYYTYLLEIRAPAQLAREGPSPEHAFLSATNDASGRSPTHNHI